jgi:hypothetical protein
MKHSRCGQPDVWVEAKREKPLPMAESIFVTPGLGAARGDEKEKPFAIAQFIIPAACLGALHFGNCQSHRYPQNRSPIPYGYPQIR